jgi:hypothetical protein
LDRSRWSRSGSKIHPARFENRLSNGDKRNETEIEVRILHAEVDFHVFENIKNIKLKK